MGADDMSTYYKDTNSNDCYGPNYKPGPASRKKDQVETSNDNENEDQNFNFLDELSFACNNFEKDASGKIETISKDVEYDPKLTPTSSPNQKESEKMAKIKKEPAGKKVTEVDSEASTEVEDDEERQKDKEIGKKDDTIAEVEVEDVSDILKSLDEEDTDVENKDDLSEEDTEAEVFDKSWLFEVLYTKMYEWVSDKNWIFEMLDAQKNLKSSCLSDLNKMGTKTSNGDGQIVIQEMENHEVIKEFEVVLKQADYLEDLIKQGDDEIEVVEPAAPSPIRLSDFCSTTPERNSAIDSSPTVPSNLLVAKSPKGEGAGDQQRQCAYCDAMFSRLRHLRNHVFLNHVKKQIDGKIIPSTWTSPFDCPKCNETFKERVRLLKHYAFEHHCKAEDLDGRVVGRDKKKKKKVKRESSSEDRLPSKFAKNKKHKRERGVSESEDEDDPPVSQRYKQENGLQSSDEKYRKKKKKHSSTYFKNENLSKQMKKQDIKKKGDYDIDDIQDIDESSDASEGTSADETMKDVLKTKKREYKKNRWGKKNLLKKNGLIDIDKFAEEEYEELKSEDDDEEKYFDTFLNPGKKKDKKEKGSRRGRGRSSKRRDSSEEEPVAFESEEEERATKRGRGRPPKRRGPSEEKRPATFKSSDDEDDPPVSARYKMEKKHKDKVRKKLGKTYEEEPSSDDFTGKPERKRGKKKRDLDYDDREAQYLHQYSQSEDEDDPPVSRSYLQKEKQSLIERSHKGGKWGKSGWYDRWEKRMNKRQEKMNRKIRRGKWKEEESEWKRLERRRKNQNFSSDDDSTDSDKSSSEQADSNDSLNEFVVSQGSDVSDSDSSDDNGPPVSRRYKESKKEKKENRKEYYDYASPASDASSSYSSPNAYPKKRKATFQPTRRSNRDRMDTNFINI